MDRTELAWAAGFFDAEGWAGAVRSRGGTRPVAQINQADASGVPEVLARFRAAVGVGRVRGPKREAGKLELYHWIASSRGDVVQTFELLAPWLGLVKTAQFEKAVGATMGPAYTPSADEERAWAAGLFDGDGSTCLLKHRSHDGYFIAEISITQASRVGLPQVLERFRSVVRGGHLNGPTGGSETWEPVYRWKAHRRTEIERVASVLWPYLGTVKRVQAMVVIDRVASQQPLPRGNPAWGNRKTHCVHGHEYATARIRSFVARNGGTEQRASKYCLACLREHVGRKRAEKQNGGS